MTSEQHTYHITFYLSDGKEVSGIITRNEDIATRLKKLQTIIENKKTIFISDLGVLMKTKHIIHVKIVEVEVKQEQSNA
ncbi:hypothetical protein [Bacillus mycoides]|uniref:DUF2642 domain-containing protein n=1 Tax=Bacillus mycoides TaxID=1405 RepID=A0ABC9QU77_BACMY|nr:hypothetical protein [Bacillus mycoides]EJR28746.1 hypothetical protein III_06083 [Bacillus mycoides]